MQKETTSVAPNLPATGFVRERDLIGDAKKSIRGIIPFSHATLWRKVKAKEFPAPRKLSANVTGWRVEEIREWIESYG